ncbi:MAG: LamG domain-containing protein [Thermoanaerobaculia bacterium]
MPLASHAADPSGAIPYAPQRQINTTSAGFQGGTVTAAAPFGWIVVWLSQNEALSNIRYRLVSRGGETISQQLPVTSGFDQRLPAITRLDDGRYLVIWAEDDAGGSVTEINGRFLLASGDLDGGVFSIQAGGPTIHSTAVAAAPAGGFVVVWRDATPGVMVRRFSGSGAPLAGALRVDTTGGFVDEPRVARLSGSGGHVLVWSSTVSTGGDGSGQSVQWRRLLPDGSLAGPEQQANSYTPGDQLLPDVASLSGGRFVIAWQSVGNAIDAPEGEPLGDGIDVRCFRSDGTPLAPEVTVSSDPGSMAYDPSIVAGPDDEILAAWASANNGLRARRLACTYGTSSLAEEFRVDDFVAATNPEYPGLAVADSGDFAVGWDSYTASPGGDDSDAAAQVRTFTIGRIASWKMEDPSDSGTAADSAGLWPDDATLLMPGTPVWSWGRGAQQALSFGGSDAASVASSNELTIMDSGVTLEGWIYLELLPSQLVEPYSSIYDSDSDNYVLYLDRDNAELRFKVTDSDGTSERPGIPESALPLRKWFHVAGIYRGEGDALIYLNGQQADRHVNANLIDPVRSSVSQIAAFGRDGALARYYLTGRIDEFSVWRRGISVVELGLVRGSWLFGDGFERGDFQGWDLAIPPP